jgi:hypothetical protein
MLSAPGWRLSRTVTLIDYLSEWVRNPDYLASLWNMRTDLRVDFVLCNVLDIRRIASRSSASNLACVAAPSNGPNLATVGCRRVQQFSGQPEATVAVSVQRTPEAGAPVVPGCRAVQGSSSR